LDVEYLKGVKVQVQKAKEILEKRIHEAMGGYKFNIASDDELRNTMWHVMGLRWEKQTSGEQYAVDREVLEGFADTNLVCKLILDWRDADKIDTTYTSSILDLLDDKNYVHGNLQQAGARTGRMSCNAPNYQNFVTDNDDRAVAFSGKKLKEGGIDPWSIRRAFVMREQGWYRVIPDFSQIELRVLAHYSKDPILVDAYLKGEDIHERTAKEVGSILQKECSRRTAKITNFGLSYGLSARGLSSQAKISKDEAEIFLAAFFQRYKGIVQFRNELCAQARRQGCQWQNMFGRPA